MAALAETIHWLEAWELGSFISPNRTCGLSLKVVASFPHRSAKAVSGVAALPITLA